MHAKISQAAIILFLTFLILPSCFAQLDKITSDIDKDKPEKFKEKTLKSEHTGEKKFTLPRRFVNNTTSHYNYYFNANNRLNQVVERARYANKDNFSKLLPFYGYSLENTKAQASDLDSVIYKATAGVLLHDLRSDWVDNLYLLIGKAYLLKKDMDSAAMTFQFINYNLYPKRKADDDKLVVGSNDNGGSAMSIANKEKRNMIQKVFTLPPSRNDALVWQIRTLVEMQEYPDAAGLINTLQNDPNFPKRLKSELEEVDAYWFYRQGNYDSAAFHLEKALGSAEDKEDKARWEFLLAQLYESTNQPLKATEYYNKAAKLTTDPLLDIYANLNNAKMYKGKEGKELDRSIFNLLHMAHRDKYESYRDIIYFAAGELSLQKPDTLSAQIDFRKSIRYNQSNVTYKNQSFLKLADIEYKRKHYKMAFALYDSLQLSDTTLADIAGIQERKSGLSKLVEQLNIIEREDSLQMVAAMNPAAQEAFLKKLAKRLAKEKGLKEEDNNSSSGSPFTDTRNLSTDLFTNNTTTGEWYFYNSGLKSKGFNDFKARWGKRQNVDNWRRRSAFEGAASALQVSTNSPDTKVKNGDSSANKLVTTLNDDITPEGLKANLPTTPEKLAISNRLISLSLFELAKIYQNNLEEYGLAAETYENSLKKFPDSLHGGEIYLNLSYCYSKLGDISKANYYKGLLNSKFRESSFAQISNHPASAVTNSKNPKVTHKYEDIYNLFIEGNFEKALHDKKEADSLYGENYWSPQLLYIESVYDIKQHHDSMAAVVLNNIITKFPSSPLKGKAETMIDVLKRRSEIEGYLTNLQVTRLPEDSITIFNDNPVSTMSPGKQVAGGGLKPSVRSADSVKNAMVKKPTVSPVVPVGAGSFLFDEAAEQYVVMLLDKVDPVYINETRNAYNRYNREKYSRLGIDITKDILDKDRNLLIFSKFPDAASAFAYEEHIKKDAASEISWLPASKYTFLVISESNLQVLKTNKDLARYRTLLNSKFPGKF